MGMFTLQQQAKEQFNHSMPHTKLRVKAIKGGASGGTVASMIEAIKAAKADPKIRRQMGNPYLLCGADHQYQLNKGASIAVKAACDQLHARKGKHFGNGRTVRNFFERCLVLQARRLCNQDRASKKDLQTFIQDDIPECSTLEW